MVEVCGLRFLRLRSERFFAYFLLNLLIFGTSPPKASSGKSDVTRHIVTGPPHASDGVSRSLADSIVVHRMLLREHVAKLDG